MNSDDIFEEEIRKQVLMAVDVIVLMLLLRKITLTILIFTFIQLSYEIDTMAVAKVQQAWPWLAACMRIQCNQNNKFNKRKEANVWARF